ncbi:glycosyltransferase involved in cell wall biosynthesis [Mucilaginibacter sp. UYNi724]
MPSLSIIVPVYNKERYIAACFDSILNQTYDDFELIVVNDGSTDGSYQKCLEYAVKDNRIKLIDQKNAGVSAARNKGLSLAKGTYIGFIDSDDTIEADMYEMLINNICAVDGDISVCRLRAVFPNKTVSPRENEGSMVYKHDEALQLFFKGQFDVSANNKIYNAKLLKNIRFEGRIYEDILFVCKAFLAAQTVVFENKVKYNYLVRENSVSMSKFDSHYMESIVVSSKMVSLMTDESKQAIEYAKAFDVMANISLLNLLLMAGEGKYLAEYCKVVGNLNAYKSFISTSGLIRKKHKYAFKIYSAFPKLYSGLMYAYCLMTGSELIKRT